MNTFVAAGIPKTGAQPIDISETVANCCKYRSLTSYLDDKLEFIKQCTALIIYMIMRKTNLEFGFTLKARHIYCGLCLAFDEET